MRFNSTKVKATPNTITYEGGAAYEKNPLEEWMNMLFSDFMEDGFYEVQGDRQQRFIDLTNAIIYKYGAEFAAKAAFFARNELGMRSISQLTAAMLNAEQFDRKRAFFRAYPHRADDVAEVFSAIDALEGKRSHACVRGFGDYLSGLNEYTLGKYKLNSRTYNMFDCINITHATSDAINKYKAGWLETPDTWETKIAGAADKESRNKEWKRLVEENKLGYLALIRNLRNILDCGVSDAWICKNLVPQLVNEKAIRKSLVFPYQIYSAYKNMSVRNVKIVAALSDAFQIAVGNLPELSGDTCIILDVSGSMDSPISARSNISIKEAGAVYAAAIMLQNPNSDFIKFGNQAKSCYYNLLDNIFDIIYAMIANDGCGYGTDIVPAFRALRKHYDRIFLISDMQVMSHQNYWWNDSRTSADEAYKDYCHNYGVTELYSFDLGNYHSQISNPNNPYIHLCTALNEKVMKFISLLEDGDSLFDYINQTYKF